MVCNLKCQCHISTVADNEHYQRLFSTYDDSSKLYIDTVK